MQQIDGPKNYDETVQCGVITIFKAWEGSSLLRLLKKKQKKKTTSREIEQADQIKRVERKEKSSCIQAEYRPEVGQSGLQGHGWVLKVEACLEAAARRQVLQQHQASLPPVVHKKPAVAYNWFKRICNQHGQLRFSM